MAMSQDSLPGDLRHLRACLSCSLIKSLEQFEADGCDNCDSFLKMKGNRHQVYDCTSSNFSGFIASMAPKESWVCKWQKINTLIPGIYAISVVGKLPGYIIREIKSKGIEYKHRDTSRR